MSRRTFTIPKSQQGHMKYLIDLPNQYIQLIEDIPEDPTKRGGHFSQEQIPFSRINAQITSRANCLDGIFLADIYNAPRTINNGTMLVAALRHLGCISINDTFIAELTPTMNLPQ